MPHVINVHVTRHSPFAHKDGIIMRVVYWPRRVLRHT